MPFFIAGLELHLWETSPASGHMSREEKPGWHLFAASMLGWPGSWLPQPTAGQSSGLSRFDLTGVSRDWAGSARQGVPAMGRMVVWTNSRTSVRVDSSEDVNRECGWNQPDENTGAPIGCNVTIKLHEERNDAESDDAADGCVGPPRRLIKLHCG